MEPTASSLLPRSARRFISLGAILAALLLAPAGHAATRVSPCSPTDYPDTAHVPNGCYLSAITYLKKFSEAHPGEQTRVLGFAPRGWGGGHFVTLITWHGEWWIRDEYFGIFPVGQQAAPAVNPAKLDQRAANTFDRQVTVRRKAGQLPILPWLPGKLTEVQKTDSIAAAANWLPFKTEQFRVKSATGEMNLLFFRPTPDRIAVYEPSHGTAVAVCAEADMAVIVAAVATRLGYTIASVRPAFPASGALVAAN